MKKFFTQGSFIILLIALFSCKRELAKKDALLTTNCRIKQLILRSPGEQEKTGSFTYDAAGNPISYQPATYGAGSLKYEFRYDKNGRLTDFIAYSPLSFPLTCEYWICYTYNNNIVVRDSVYYNTNYGQEITWHAKHVGITNYEYDKQERIKRIMYKQYFNGVPNGVVGNYKFDYNDAGNLVIAGAMYDDKVSIFRTNKVWMFLSRNYSANNARSASSYNSKGLPVAFAAANGRSASMKFFEAIDLSNCEIQYECVN